MKTIETKVITEWFFWLSLQIQTIDIEATGLIEFSKITSVICNEEV